MRLTTYRFATAIAFFSALSAGLTTRANLLVNGNFDAAPGAYFDGFDPTVADDVLGWNLFLGAADGSYVLVSAESDPLAGVHDLDMGIGPAGGGIETAAGSRPAVSPGVSYTARVTTDNYFAPTGAAYFIDWYDNVGVLISSIGGPLFDPDPFTYAPYTQLYSVTGTAPVNAATAGVRFTSGNPGYAGLAADNFALVPEPTSLVLFALATAAWFGMRGRKRAEG